MRRYISGLPQNKLSNENRRDRLNSISICGIHSAKGKASAVVCETKDGYRDLVLCAISSVLRSEVSENDVILKTDSENGLRKDSVLKVDGIVTARSYDVITSIGNLSKKDLEQFREKFVKLIER